MEATKKILNISIAVSIVLLSISALIYSAKNTKVYAQTRNVGTAQVAGVCIVNGRIKIIGYKTDLGAGEAVELASMPAR